MKRYILAGIFLLLLPRMAPAHDRDREEHKHHEKWVPPYHLGTPAEEEEKHREEELLQIERRRERREERKELLGEENNSSEEQE